MLLLVALCFFCGIPFFNPKLFAVNVRLVFLFFWFWKWAKLGDFPHAQQFEQLMMNVLQFTVQLIVPGCC
jgi:hypothetical protein